MKPGTSAFVLLKEGGIGQWEVPCLKLSSINCPFLMIYCNKDTCFIFQVQAAPMWSRKNWRRCRKVWSLKPTPPLTRLPFVLQKKHWYSCCIPGGNKFEWDKLYDMFLECKGDWLKSTLVLESLNTHAHERAGKWKTFSKKDPVA